MFSCQPATQHSLAIWRRAAPQIPREGGDRAGKENYPGPVAPILLRTGYYGGSPYPYYRNRIGDAGRRVANYPVGIVLVMQRRSPKAPENPLLIPVTWNIAPVDILDSGIIGELICLITGSCLFTSLIHP